MPAMVTRCWKVRFVNILRAKLRLSEWKNKFCGSKTKKCLHFIVKMLQNKTEGQIYIWFFPSGSKFVDLSTKVRISEHKTKGKLVFLLIGRVNASSPCASLDYRWNPILKINRKIFIKTFGHSTLPLDGGGSFFSSLEGLGWLVLRLFFASTQNSSPDFYNI